MNGDALPLARFRVLDLSRVRAGPTAVRQLADWGADVIKIEPPESMDAAIGMGGPRHGPDFQNIHRNKRGMTLNLKEPDGLALFMRLAETADVVVENFRPDVKKRLRLDYQAVKAVNPRLVYASISGFGQDGPYALRPGFDQIAQGLGGLMSITGQPGQGPMRVGVPIADLAAGLYAAIGILIALLEREQTGEGRWVQTSLLQAQIAMLDFQAARWLIGGEVPAQAGNNHPTSIPTGVFTTTDGHINVAASGDAMWERLCDAVGATDLKDDPDYATLEDRQKNRDALNARLDSCFSTKSSAAWIDILNAAGVSSGPIHTIDAMFADPQVRHLGMEAPVEHPVLGPIRVVDNAIHMAGAPRGVRRPTPERGQHTDEVLTELGLAAEDIARLRDRHII